MMRLGTIADWTHGTLIGADAVVHGVVTVNTRKLSAGDLFAAFKGEHVDGHDYLDEAMRRGAVGALVTKRVDSPLPQVHVADMERALANLASAVRVQRQVRMIGITGSNGKTTVKNLLASILSLHGATHANKGSFNNEIGLPLTLLSMPVDTQYAVLEMGAGKPGDIAYLAAIAKPDVALVTLIAPAHLERMVSVEMVAQTKGALYQALPADGVAIINADDAFADFFVSLAGTRRLLRFGLKHQADVSAQLHAQHADASLWTLRTPVGEVEVKLPLPGQHNVINALAAATAALALDVPLATIASGLERAVSLAGRLHRIVMPDGWTLIDDSYNANPHSMGAAIETLRLSTGECWLVMGDMAELGSSACHWHAEIGRKARACGVARLFATGPLSAVAVDAFGDHGEHFADKGALLRRLQAYLHTGVICLVKGSRSAAMDQIVKALCPQEDRQGVHRAS